MVAAEEKTQNARCCAKAGPSSRAEPFSQIANLETRRLVGDPAVERTTAFFQRHGGWIIVFARFIDGLRQANGIIAGTTGIRWTKFLAFNLIGAALWAAAWTSVGYFAGNHITPIYNTASRYSIYLAIAVGALVVFFVVRHVVRARKARARAGV